MDRAKLELEDVFCAAMELASPAERAAYLDQACGDDLDARRGVERLLAAHAQAGSFLGAGPSVVAATTDLPAHAIGTKIGPYKLLQQIGEGGMGTVFMAEQTEPVKRKVALKVIKAGMDSRQVIGRFEAERQALAMMDHVNIARVLDAGATESGRPYFVMELVHGVPITKYCDDNHLTPRERLELFVPVCQAIQHAHQKGTIHRDLKPSNVMVTLYDGKPVPKVIDFGVAKATEQKLTERTLFTQYGTMVGTLEYMSPEQADMSALGVDTRSDIYSLGVLLYELLTGSTPLSHKRLKEAAYAEILRLIKEEEPPRPSTRLSDSGAALASISAQRHMEPAKLTKLVRGELDWIVMKTLEKDRNRRYETANGLALDVERYLADEPVQACPASAWYGFRKFVRRNRGPVLAASLVFLALAAGMIGTTVGLVRAERSRLVAEANEQDAQAERAKALDAAEAERTAKDTALKRLGQIEKGNEILASIFTGLDPHAEEKEGKPLQVLLGERLDQAVAQLQAEAIGDPVTVAKLQNTLGVSLLGLGHAEKAVPLFTQARQTFTVQLGPDHHDTLVSMNNLALGYERTGKLDLALPLYEQTLKLSIAKQGPDHPDTLTGMANLAMCYQAAGKLDLALPLLEETLKLRKAKLGPDHLHTLISMINLATGYGRAGKLDLALPLLEETLKLARAKLGPDHTNTLSSMNNLAWGYRHTGKLDLALPLYEETLKLIKAKLGPEHPRTLDSMNNLADSYRAARKLDLALPLLEETLKLKKAKFGPDHPDTLGSVNNLALGYESAGRLDLALPLLEETLKLKKAKLGPDHPSTLVSMNNLALGYEHTGKLDLALALHKETLKLSKAKLGPDHPDTVNSMNNLAWIYQAAGKLDLALPLFQQAAAEVEKLKFLTETAGQIIGNLSDCHEQLQQLDLAETWRRKWLAVVREKAGPESATYAEELAPLGANLVLQKKYSDAESVLRECLTIRARKQPDAWTTFNTQSLLGGALLGQKKYAEAEPLLLQGFEGMKQREAKIPATAKVRLTEALERLVRLYDVWGKPDEAVKWKKELEAHRKKP